MNLFIIFLVSLHVTLLYSFRASTLDRMPAHGSHSHSGHSSRQNTGDLPHMQHPVEVETLLAEGYSLEAVKKALLIVDSNIEKARRILDMFVLK